MYQVTGYREHDDDYEFWQNYDDDDPQIDENFD